MNTLERITTEYVAREDRIRMSGALVQGGTVVLWLTQRLLVRLVPHLTGWLAKQVPTVSGIAAVQANHEDIVQGFAQQAARAQLAPEPPVRASSPIAEVRVDEVDIVQDANGVALTFKADGGWQAVLRLGPQPLRQWLGIIHEHFLRAEWPTAAWPAWMQAVAPAPAGPGKAQLH